VAKAKPTKSKTDRAPPLKKRSRAAAAPPDPKPAPPAAAVEYPPEARPKGALDDVKRRDIIAILSVGCSRTTAAQYVGCHVSTITRTAARDPEFEEQVRQAESLLEIKHLKNIDAAAKDTRYWRAAAWALERRWPQRWGPRRAASLSAEQVGQALEQFAQLVVEEVTEVETRDRILKRLDELAAELAHRESEAAEDEG
jgi:hypothetical protein